MHYKPLTEVKTDIYVIMTTGRIKCAWPVYKT